MELSVIQPDNKFRAGGSGRGDWFFFLYSKEKNTTKAQDKAPDKLQIERKK